MHTVDGFTTERIYSNQGLETLHPTAKDISPVAMAVFSRDQQLLDYFAPKTFPLFLRAKKALDRALQEQTSIVNDKYKAIFENLITTNLTAVQRFTEESVLRDRLVSERLKHAAHLAVQGEDLTKVEEDLRKLAALREDLAVSHHRVCNFHLLLEKDTFSIRMQSGELYVEQVSKLNTTLAKEVCASWERVKNEANITAEWARSTREFQLAQQKQNNDYELEQLRLENDRMNIANTRYQQIEDTAIRRTEMMNRHEVKQIETNTARIDSLVNGAATLTTPERPLLDTIIDGASYAAKKAAEGISKVWKWIW